MLRFLKGDTLNQFCEVYCLFVCFKDILYMAEERVQRKIQTNRFDLMKFHMDKPVTD